ncbi:MAG: hypothetical protein GX643_14670, partial [Acidimicrobiales bacterium]|nr:hypothetical protein [Acidimicrobiales bacterium]
MRAWPGTHDDRSPRAVLGRPAFLLTLLVLVANDHVLKAAFPGWVTGKVSDFAGPAALAVVASTLIGRRAAVGLTVVGFVALKTVPGVAESAEPLLGGITRRDPTDLIGLAALPLVWRWLGAMSDDETAARSATSDGSRPAAHGPTRGWVTTKALPIGGAALAVVGFTATSAAQRAEVRSLAVTGSTVHATVAEDSGPTAHTRRAMSTDGGRTWAKLDDTEPDLDGSTESTEEACRSDGHCFAARGGSVEEKPPGGDWSTAFSFSSGDRELIDYRRPSGGAEFDRMFQSVLVVPGEEGESVLVTARDQGVLVLDPDGDWRRVRVLDVKPTSTNGTMVPLDVSTVALFLSLPVAGIAAVVRAIARRRGGAWAAVGSVVGAMV